MWTAVEKWKKGKPMCQPLPDSQRVNQRDTQMEKCAWENAGCKCSAASLMKVPINVPGESGKIDTKSRTLKHRRRKKKKLDV